MRGCPFSSVDEQICKLELRRRDLRKTEARTVYIFEHNSEENYDEYLHGDRLDLDHKNWSNEHKDDHDVQSIGSPRIRTTTIEALFTEMILQQGHNSHLLAIENHSAAWYLDLGASNHVTCNCNLLVGIKPIEHNKVVHTAGGQSLSLKGIRSVIIKLSSGEKKNP